MLDSKHLRIEEAEGEALECEPTDSVGSAFPQLEINEEERLERFPVGQEDKGSASLELVAICVILLASVVSGFLAVRRILG